MDLLTEQDHLNQIVHLVGPDALPDEQRLTLLTASLLTQGFLQQSALDDVDTYASPAKQIGMLDLILKFHDRAMNIIKLGAISAAIQNLPIVRRLLVMKNDISNAGLDQFAVLETDLNQQMDELEARYT